MSNLLEHLMVDVGDTGRRAVDAPTDLKFVGPATAAAIEDAGFDAQAIADKEVSYRILLEAGVNPGVAAKIRRYHSLAWSFDNDGDLGRRSKQVRGLEEDEAEWVASSSVDDGDSTAAAAESADTSPTTAADGDSDGEAAWVANATDGDSEPQQPPDEHADSAATDDEAAWVASATAGDDASATADGSGDPTAAEAAWRERSKPTPISSISGVGESYVEKLAEAGVTSVRSLATASPELLADVTGISEQRLRRWHRKASERAD